MNHSHTTFFSRPSRESRNRQEIEDLQEEHNDLQHQAKHSYPDSAAAAKTRGSQNYLNLKKEKQKKLNALQRKILPSYDADCQTRRNSR